MEKRASSVTNAQVTSFAENRTFRAFVALYAVMSLLILALLGALYYRYQKEVMLSEHRLAMQLEAENYLPRLVKWMQGQLDLFPEDPAYATAFYLQGRRIGGKVDLAAVRLVPGIQKEAGTISLVIPMGSYGLKEGMTVMQTRDDGLWLRAFWRTALLAGSALFALLLLAGIELSRLFLRPMQEAVELLDSFIKDTTHELNTPVTAILTNIERLDRSALDERSRKKVARIDTAARTIETIYDDLTYLLLRHDVACKDEAIVLSELIAERLDYFKTRHEMKRLNVIFEPSPLTVMMDRRRAVRLLDNLLSNAVKYSDIGGTILITMTEEGLTVANDGITIPSDKIGKIFERYSRADESRGGFGIGLHIVARIAEEYGIRIRVTSEEGETRFKLTWPRYTPQSS